MKKDTAASATTSHASEKKTVEQVGSNRISLSGKRLRLIADQIQTMFRLLMIILRLKFRQNIFCH